MRFAKIGRKFWLLGLARKASFLSQALIFLTTLRSRLCGEARPEGPRSRCPLGTALCVQAFVDAKREEAEESEPLADAESYLVRSLRRTLNANDLPPTLQSWSFD